MADGIQQLTEVLSASLEEFIVALGDGISKAQTAMDRASIATQETLDTDPQLASYGLQATWYQFPRVDLQLKLAFTVTGEGLTGGGPAAVGGAAALAAPAGLRLIAQPVNAAYVNHFNYDAQGASTVSLSIVPVPPARSADQAAVAPLLSPAQVQAIALAAPGAGFVTVTDAQGATVPSPSLRFDIRFNAPARAWYVIQFDPSKPAAKATVVMVDDVTRATRVIS